MTDDIYCRVCHSLSLIVQKCTKLDQGAIRSSQRHGSSPPERFLTSYRLRVSRGGEQDFIVSPSPFKTNWVIDLLGLGLRQGFGIKGYGPGLDNK